MAAGDAQRVWFPQLVDLLRKEWTPQLSWDAWVNLRDRLDAELQRIRTERNIQPARMWCPHCGKYGPQAPPKVSVRAAILALQRFGIADKAMVQDLDRRWSSHRRRESLDLHGKPVVTKPVPHSHS